MRGMLMLIGLLAGLVSPADYPNPGTVTGAVNGVHDPAMVRAADGRYLLVSTGTNLPIRTSTDRTAFRTAGTVWPNGAPWAHPFTGGTNTLWAPDLSFRNGRYYLADLGSSNGTFIKLHGERVIEPGAFVLLGQQLFRVNFG